MVYLFPEAKIIFDVPPSQMRISLKSSIFLRESEILMNRESEITLQICANNNCPAKKWQIYRIENEKSF